MAVIGLKELHYAILDSDTAAGAVYQAPVKIVGAIQANINPNPSIETLFADDAPMETASTLGAIELEMIAKDFPIEVQAALLGHQVVGGIMKRNADDIPPFVAIGFKSLKSNGYYRYIWLLKGKFQVPEQSHETKGDSINFQTPTLTGKFVLRDFDRDWMHQTDEDFADYVASIGTNWFSAVDGVADTTPPTVTTTPADAAATVAVASNIVWTFDEAIKASSVTRDNFFVVKQDGTPVAGSLSINAAHTIVTFDPDADLTAATQYLAIATTAVQDIAGNPLAATSVTNFTTA